MNAVGLDTFLKATQEAPKAKPPTPSQGSGEFNDYLREAAHAQPQPAKEQPAVKTKPVVETPTQSTSQEQASADSSEEQTNVAVEAAEQTDENQNVEFVEEQAAETETDEVLLSVAAIVASAAEVVPVIETTEVTLEVAVEAAPAEPAQPQPAQEAATAPDFLPDLEQAVTELADTTVNSVVPVTAELSVPVETSYGDDALLPVASEPAAQEPVPGPIPRQEAITQQESAEPIVEVSVDQPKQNFAVEGAQQAAAPIVAHPQSKARQAPIADATVTNGEIEQPEASEHKPAKPTVADKQAVAEQLVTQVAAAVVESDSTRETKHAATAEAGTTTPDIQADPLTQQQSPTRDAGRADAQALQSDGDSRMPTIDRTRFVQRVANAFRSAQQNDGHIQMRLSPPELGSLRIEIAVRNGVLTANLETETADARRVLLDNLPALRQRLAEQDIRIEKFDVDVRREGNQSDGQTGAQDRQAQQQSQRAAAQNRIRTTTPAEVISARVPRSQQVASNSGLDVRI
jgi:flagellar hook-length control protein FliK